MQEYMYVKLMNKINYIYNNESHSIHHYEILMYYTHCRDKIIIT